MFGLGLSFEISGLDLDRKIWQSAPLISVVYVTKTCSDA